MEYSRPFPLARCCPRSACCSASQVLLFEPLLAWLEAANASHSRLQGRLDLSQLVAAGHSRGGKLATLLFSGKPAAGARTGAVAAPGRLGRPGASQKALTQMLIAGCGDMNCGAAPSQSAHALATWSPLLADAKLCSRVRAAYLVDPVDLFSPSAVEALEHAGRRVGVTGGGVWGPLNPPLVNYQVGAES